MSKTAYEGARSQIVRVSLAATMVSGADVVFISYEQYDRRTKTRGFLDVAPELVVEIAEIRFFCVLCGSALYVVVKVALLSLRLRQRKTQNQISTTSTAVAAA